PPPRASTLHSFAMGGDPGIKPSASVANIRGGSQAVTAERGSMPGQKLNFIATGFPSRTSNSVGTNQDEMPGPVALACQTSSGVPGTSTSNWTETPGGFFLHAHDGSLDAEVLVEGQFVTVWRRESRSPLGR